MVKKKKKGHLYLNSFREYIVNKAVGYRFSPRLLPGRRQPRAGLPQAKLVVCGLLTSVRKKFTTRVQEVVRVRLIRLGTVTQKKDLG